MMYELSQMFGTAVSERQRFKELHQASQYLARVADMTADAVLAVNDNGRIEVWNKGAVKLFGYSKEEAAHLNVREVLSIDTGDKGLNAWVTEAASTRAADVAAHRKDKTEFTAGVTFSTITGDDGEVLGVSVVVRDMDERKRIERELIQSRKLLSSALHAADVGLFVLDRDGEIVEFNARMQDLTGMTRASLHDEDLESVAQKLLEEPAGLVTAVRDRVLTRGKHVELRNLKLRRP